MDLTGAFLLHTAPGVRKVGPGRYEKICIQHDDERSWCASPRGSARSTAAMRAICGKGGFPDEAIEPMQRLGMVYFAIVGGAAALETTQIEEIEESPGGAHARVPVEVPRQGLRPPHGGNRRSRELAVSRRPGSRPPETGGHLCTPLTRTRSSTFPRAREAPRARPHARHGQGLEPPRDRGALRHRRRVRRHREARLGYELRHEQPREEGRALPFLLDAGRLRRNALRGRLRAREGRRFQALARALPLLASRSRMARSTFRGSRSSSSSPISPGTSSSSPRSARRTRRSTSPRICGCSGSARSSTRARGR